MGAHPHTHTGKRKERERVRERENIHLRGDREVLKEEISCELDKGGLKQDFTLS